MVIVEAKGRVALEDKKNGNRNNGNTKNKAESGDAFKENEEQLKLKLASLHSKQINIEGKGSCKKKKI